MGGGLHAQFTFKASPSVPFLFFGLAFLGTAIPYGAFYFGIGRLPSGIASLLMLPEVIAVFIFSAIFLGQPITGAQLVGGAIIMSAGLLVSRG